MKLLAIDVGNTSTAVGLWSDGRVSKTAHCDGGFDDAAAVAARLVPSVSGVAYVSVVPKMDRKWKAFARKHGLAWHQVSHRDFAIGRKIRQANVMDIVLDYPRPETIGADRLADAAGAVSRYGAPVLVMDFGTALTAAIVTRDRVWRGGVIAPGFPLMRDYLFERTAKLPRMRLGGGKVPKIGRSTEEAMHFGAIVGYQGMVKEIVKVLRRNFKQDFRMVATGGFAKWVLDGIDIRFVIDPTLTLYGAGMICARQF